MDLQKAIEAAAALTAEVTALKKEVDAAVAAVAEREAIVKASEARLAVARQDLDAREAALKPVEDITKALNDVDRARGELLAEQKKIAQMQADIQNREDQAMSRIKKAELALGNLTDLKAQLVQDKANLEAEKLVYKEKIMKEFRDRLKLGA